MKGSKKSGLAFPSWCARATEKSNKKGSSPAMFCSFQCASHLSPHLLSALTTLIFGPHSLNKWTLIGYNFLFPSINITRKRMRVCVVVSLRLLPRVTSGVHVFALTFVVLSSSYPRVCCGVCACFLCLYFLPRCSC